MNATTISSREFNQDTGGAKRAANKGPVVITERGKPSFVLISYERYEQLLGGKQNIADLLAMPEAADIELELPSRDWHISPAEFD